jgi:glycerol-3-phosphate dehydrogenase (NAD(P)+)
MERVGVIGLGNWGTALANHFGRKGLKVSAWGRDPDLVASINSKQRNPRFLSSVELSSSIRATTDLAVVCSEQFLVIALPSQVLETLAALNTIKPDAIVASAVKGLQSGSLKTPLQFLADRIGGPDRLCVVSGPSFASDLVAHRPIGVVVASTAEGTARRVAEALTSEWLRAYTSTDPLGVELGGVVKNVIALAAGVCDGLKLGESARAGLITRGLAEMTRLAVAMGANERTLSGLSGLGDLAMTATSATSRNYTVGFRLGGGEPLDAIAASIGSVAEGVRTTPLVVRLGEQHGVDLPISAAVGKVLAGSVTPTEMAKALISRPIKPEFH